MLRFARWCITHRLRVALAWIVALVVITALAQAAGRNYSNNFTLPGTESQRATDLLMHRFPTQAGDSDTIVWHVSSGHVTDAPVVNAITPMLARVGGLAHVVGVIGPYGPRGAQQVSGDRRTAFAAVAYDRRANLLPNSTGTALIAAMHTASLPGLRLAAGGQVVQQSERVGVGPATAVGVVAALVILFLTFGSLTAAGLPLLTAGLGLITGTAIIGLGTHVIDTTNFAPELAVMIGLGVGVDYALFIVTRFREAYRRVPDVEAAVLQAMDTSGRAVLLAGATVIIALLGMFTLGVSFLNGVAVAAAIAVLLVLAASLTVLPAMLSRFGARVAQGGRRGRRRAAASSVPEPGTRWRAWAEFVAAHPLPLGIASLAIMVAFILPATALRLDNSDAGNNPAQNNSRQSYDLLASGFGKGFNGPLLIVAQLPRAGDTSGLPRLSAALSASPDVATVTAPRLNQAGDTATLRVYPDSAPQALATTELVNRLRHSVIPPVARSTGQTVLVGGFTAGSIDFANVLSSKLPLFIAVVIALSALLLLVIFRSLVIPLQAAVMNLLSIGAALGVVTAIFQWGWLGGLVGVRKGPIEAFIPVLMFAIVFGLSMDYEVFLISRIHEEWTHRRDASRAVTDGIAFSGRVISAAGAIMVFVFASFLLGDERIIKEFGFGLAVAVLLDAFVVRCFLLPAVLQLLGDVTWRLPAGLERILPRINIEGSAAAPPDPRLADRDDASDAAQTPVGAARG